MSDLVGYSKDRVSRDAAPSGVISPINTDPLFGTVESLSLRAVETFKRKRMGQTAASDNQSSTVTLNELAKKARNIYCNSEFQRRSHTMTEINLNRAQITKTV